MQIKVESNQPIPIKKKERKYKFLDKLEMGQNVLVQSLNDALKIRDAMRHRNMQYTMRKSPEGDGWRVWYIGDVK